MGYKKGSNFDDTDETPSDSTDARWDASDLDEYDHHLTQESEINSGVGIRKKRKGEYYDDIWDEHTKKPDSAMEDANNKDEEREQDSKPIEKQYAEPTFNDEIQPHEDDMIG